MSVRDAVRENLLSVTAALSLVSLALVFAAAMRVVPAASIPHAPEAAVAAIPHANAVLSVAAIGTIAAGWRLARRGDYERHRVAMGSAVVLFFAFLALYLYKVALEGPTEFTGPEAVGTYLYLPLLAVHILLAIVCVPLVYYVLLLGATHEIPELKRTPHRRVGRVAASLWLVSFALGVVVYLLLYVVY